MSQGDPNIKPLDGAVYERIIEVVRHVVAARAEQEHEWGESDHDFGMWMVILQKQLGKAVSAMLDDEPDLTFRKLVHTAAVNIAMIECGIRLKWWKLP